MELQIYFGHKGQEFSYTEQTAWLIRHHPDVKELAMVDAMSFRRWTMSEGSREEIRTAWEKATTERPNSPVVLFNAAICFQRDRRTQKQVCDQCGQGH